MRAMSAVRSCAFEYESSSFSGYTCRNGFAPCARAVCSNAVKTVVTGQDGKMPRAVQTTGEGNESKAFDCGERRHRRGFRGRSTSARGRYDHRHARLPGIPDLLAQL